MLKAREVHARESSWLIIGVRSGLEDFAIQLRRMLARGTR